MVGCTGHSELESGLDIHVEIYSYNSKWLKSYESAQAEVQTSRGNIWQSMFNDKIDKNEGVTYLRFVACL